MSANRLICLCFLLFSGIPAVLFAQEKTTLQNTKKDFKTEVNELKWRISVEGGTGYRIASTKETRQNLLDQGFEKQEVNAYLNSLKLGLKTSAQVHYMFWDNLGLGIDYQLHQSSGSIRGTIDPGDGATLLYGDVTDKIYTNYTGPSAYYQEWIGTKTKLFCQISLGLTMFREETVYIYSPLLYTGKAFGGNTEIGLEYFMLKNLAFAVNADFFQSTITKVKVNDGNNSETLKLHEEQYEGISRVDFGLGLKFYL